MEATKYVGNDIDENGVDSEKPEDCYLECVKADGCHAWTFVVSENRCLLKYTKNETQTGNADYISGPKIFEGMQYVLNL